LCCKPCSNLVTNECNIAAVAAAAGGHNVALEIQATIPVGGAHPTSSIPTMMRGVNITYLATAACYFGVSIMGFYAFGSGVADNVLMAFPQGPYHGVVAAANFMVRGRQRRGHKQLRRWYCTTTTHVATVERSLQVPA
jgi:hypothetical protein